jgi:hypothetical protein
MKDDGIDDVKRIQRPLTGVIIEFEHVPMGIGGHISLESAISSARAADTAMAYDILIDRHQYKFGLICLSDSESREHYSDVYHTEGSPICFPRHGVLHAPHKLTNLPRFGKA